MAIKTPVNIRIGMGTSSASNEVAPSIRIEDRVSGLSIIDIQISAADLTSLLASRQVVAMANLPSAQMYEREVGKRMEIKTIAPSEWPEGWTVRRPSNAEHVYVKEETEEMNTFGLEMTLLHEFDTFRWSLHNYGWNLILRRWVETTEDERVGFADRYVGIAR